MLSIGATAQKTALGIGDAAPPIKYSKWLKGKPVEAYRDDRVYVLEFWATWCGPCIAAMPHLSELSEKYKKDATFIGVNVLEKVGEKPYESALPEVTKFVKGSANRMTYDVIVDNNAQDMNNTWLKPAGIAGIPVTFVVSKGKIVWIGHPMSLDTVMAPVIAGTFDVEKFKVSYAKSHSADVKQAEEIRAAYMEVVDAAGKKDFEEAFRLVDENIRKVPLLKIALRTEKFKILLQHFDEKAALRFADTLMQEGAQYTIGIASAIADKDGLSKSSYLFAADAFEKAASRNAFSALYDKVALCYSKAGDLQSAAKAQQQAIEAARREVKDPKYGGRVFEHTITDYEEKLKKYQSSIQG